MIFSLLCTIFSSDDNIYLELRGVTEQLTGEPEPVGGGEEEGEDEPEQISEPLETAVDEGTEQVGQSNGISLYHIIAGNMEKT